MAKAKPKKVKKPKLDQSPQARRDRRRERRMNDPNELLKPLTPKLLDQQAATAARTRFAPVERQLAGEQLVSGEQQRRIGGYFDVYRQQLAQAQQQQQAAYTQAQQTVEQNAQRDTPSPASPEAQQAAQARQAMSRSFGSMLATQGASQAAYGADQQRVAGLTQTKAHMDEEARKRALDQKIRELAVDKGDYVQQFKAEGTEKAQRAAVEREALGLKTADQLADNKRQDQAAKAKARQDKWERQYKQQTARREDRKVSNAEAKDAYQRAHKLGPYKPPSARGSGGSGGKGQTAADKKRIIDGREKITTARRAFVRSGRNYRKYADTAPGDMPLPVIHAGYELEKQGYVGPNTTRELKEIGITIPSKWRRRPPLNRPTGSRPG